MFVVPKGGLAMIAQQVARNQPQPIGAIDRLGAFAKQGVDEYDRSGLGGLETTIIQQGGRRSLGDIARIGSDAGAMSDRAYDASAGIAGRQMRALGERLDPAQQAAYSRRLGLSKALGNVDARNRALKADATRRDAIRTGSFGLRDLIDQQIYANLEGAGNIEGGVERDAAASSALRKQQNQNTIGQTAGMLLSMFGGK